MVSSTFPADFLTSSLFFVLLFLVLNISPLYCLEHDRTNHFVSGLGLTTTIFSPLEYFMNLKQTASVICNSFKTITICFVDTRCNKVKLLGLKLMRHSWSMSREQPSSSSGHRALKMSIEQRCMVTTSGPSTHTHTTDHAHAPQPGFLAGER